MNSKAIFLVSAFLALVVSGCGIIDYYYLPLPEDTAQELYENGREAMYDKDYYTAADYFEKLKDRFPFSPYTPMAEIGLGDAYFLNEDYLAAVDAYKEFEALHPRHEEIPYVLFQIGVASYLSFTSIDRPQDQVVEGIQYLNQLKELYPETEYAQKADDYILRSRRILAEREVFVADFYWAASKYGPAYKRYQYVVDNYPDIEDASLYASRQAELAYLRYQREQTEAEQNRIYGTWTDWLDWL